MLQRIVEIINMGLLSDIAVLVFSILISVFISKRDSKKKSYNTARELLLDVITELRQLVMTRWSREELLGEKEKYAIEMNITSALTKVSRYEKSVYLACKYDAQRVPSKALIDLRQAATLDDPATINNRTLAVDNYSRKVGEIYPEKY